MVNISSSTLQNGHYIWRVIPGYLVNAEEVTQGNTSNYGSFTIYESILNRITISKVLRVGVSPTLHGGFKRMSENGTIIGFDIDLINWLAKELTKKFGLTEEIKVKIIKIPWAKLLTQLQENNLEMVISSMTSTKKRELSHKGVKFSKGYYKTHQIFVSKNNLNDFPDGLSTKTVGVSYNTTNEEAGKVLSKIFQFKLDNSYDTYLSLLRALDANKIDYALVDDVLVFDILGKRVYKYGSELDQYLKAFYLEEYEREFEEYGVAVVD